MAKKKKDDEENTFAEGLGSLGKALSAKQERESTLESLATIADAAATWMEIRARNQDKSKEKIEVKTTKNSSFAELNRYYNILTDKNSITDFFGEDSDVNRNFFREAEALNPEDPMQSLLGKNFQVNMSSMSGVMENTSNEAFTAQYQSKYADMVKQSGEQKEATIPQNKPANVEALDTPESLVGKITPSSTKTEIPDPEKLKEDQKITSEETDTKVEEVENTTESDQTDNVEVEEPVTTDTSSENTTDYSSTLLDDDKKKGSLFRKAG
tara:strand:- start:376 stop:1182 length:807 start_codon:yes stop_codon:yes gene_type:complete